MAQLSYYTILTAMGFTTIANPNANVMSLITVATFDSYYSPSPNETISFGYADDAAGTNFVVLGKTSLTIKYAATTVAYSPPKIIPSGKYILCNCAVAPTAGQLSSITVDGYTV